MPDYDALCHRLVADFKNLTQDEFTRRYDDEVGDSTEPVRGAHTIGNDVLYELPGGLTAVCSGSARWSLYESEARVLERDHLAAWAEFARGYWSETAPKDAGTYFVKDRDLGKRTVREIIRREGKLMDVSGGKLNPGQVTAFAGYWWLPAVPQLRGSY